LSARLLDGKAVAAEVEKELLPLIHRLAARGIRPGLAAVRVGDNPAAELYVRSKARKAEQLGLAGLERYLPATITEEELLAEIEILNADDSVDGILVQMPLPAHINSRRVIESMDPSKDVDGFHPLNVGRLHLGQPTFIPCTPAGVIRLIESTGWKIAGSRVCVVGRSDIVGKPAAALLLQRHATVTICHSHTRDLERVVREADVVIAAVGKPHLVKGTMIRPGAIVIDVGINRLTGDADLTLPEAKRKALASKGSIVVGDVEFESAKEVAGWITPVPGGVGPMTIAMLMKNTVRAAMERRG
jgi:methylenetetrahydrofolate dehydrogenase (NADP+)/methenyltetrahydrofolate cyclohydrolase